MSVVNGSSTGSVNQLQVRLSAANAYIAELEATNKRLTEALEFYGEPKNYEYEFYPYSDLGPLEPRISKDKGQRARQAIKGDG